MLHGARRIGQHVDAGLHAARIDRQFSLQRRNLMQHDPGVIEQTLTGSSQPDPAPLALQQQNSEPDLQRLDARTCRRERKSHARSAPWVMLRVSRDRHEQPEIGEIEMHRFSPRLAFVFAEG